MLTRLRIIAATVRANRRARALELELALEEAGHTARHPELGHPTEAEVRAAANDLLRTEGLEHATAEAVIVELDRRRARR